ncbi:MAG: T9SS type A sorting domain-containing protein [Balneolaceae bacterium]
MKKHLQYLLLSTTAVVLLAMGNFSSVQAQELNNVWERTSRTGAAEALPSWFTIGSIRGMDLYGDSLYIADRANSQIRVLNASTGADVTLTTPYDLTGVAGGTYALNDIALSDDGVAFLGNLTTNASTSPFHLYWWTGEGGTYADSLSITTATAQRLGDKFTVVGSVTENTVEVWIPAASSDPGVIYVLTTADQGATWDTETITLSGTNVTLGSNVDVIPLALGRTSDFYIGGNSSAPARYTSSGAYIENSALASASRNGMEAFTYDSKDHLAVYTYRPDGVGGGNKTGQVYIYDVSDGANPTIIAESPLLGDDADTFSSIYGDTRVSLNEDGTFNVIALDGVNGFAAFTNAAPPVVDDPSNLIFSEYIEGSGNNKALEITNLSDSTVVLSNYQIAQTNNGSGWTTFHKFATDAEITAGGLYVITTDQVDMAIYDTSNADEVLGYDNVTFSNPVHFNGDDARALIHIDSQSGDTTWIDIFGEANLDPGSGWSVAGVANATREFSLIRKPSVTTGNTTPLGSFGTNYDDSEWILKSQNVFHNLGLASEAQGALSGDYYIPQRFDDAEGFISLHQAIHYVNTEGLTSSANLFITDDLDETSFELKIDRDDLTEFTGLTIKPVSGETPTIEVWGGSGSDGIWINNTDHVTIDGSNTPGGDTRDLTITSSDTTFAALIYTYGTNHTTIANSILTYTGGDVGASAIVTNESGPNGTENLLVYNNLIGSVNGDFQNGVGLWGTSSVQANNSTVYGNRIHATYRGVTTWWSLNNNIMDNTISIDSPRADRSRYAGIYLALNGGQTVVTGNKIVGLQINRTTTPGFAAGILFNASLDTVLVANNMIAFDNFANLGAATGNDVYGIAFDNAAGNSLNAIYHNSVRIGSSSETGVHAAFGAHQEVSTAQMWDLTNNIFVVDQDAANANAIYWPIDTNTQLEADYNNYYVSGSSANLGLFDATDTPTLEDWQTASDNDDNSSEVEVEFISATDLHLTGSSVGDVNLAGTPILNFTEDIDGTERSLIAPYKGAVEGDIELVFEITIGDFALLTPADSSSFDLDSDPDAELSFTWETAESNADVTYLLLIDSLDGDFLDPVFEFDSDEDGEAPFTSGPYADVDSALASIGVLDGETITMKWTVVAFAGDSTKLAQDSNVITFTRKITVSNEEEVLPSSFKLEQNYPNPFNPTSTIQFSLPEASQVRLDVFTITGQLVATLVDNRLSSGQHSVTFDARNLASGIYIYRIVAGKFVQTKRMTLIK